MKLLYPDFLWALFLVLVPIIIHLFNFKKFKKAYFSNVNLLKEVKLETQSKSKLKHLLVLLTRIVAIVLLVIAFCQPYIDTNEVKKTVDNVIGIYLDNSQSMDVKSSDGYLLDIAKSTALDIVSAYSPSDEFQLLTNDFEGKHQRLVSQEEMKKLIEEVSLSPISKSFEEIYEREQDLLKNYIGEKQLFWLSDFQQNKLNLGAIPLDSIFKLKLIPFAQEEISNIYIDSVWFSSPLRQVNQDEQLNVRIVNQSNNDIGTKVNLKVNNEIKGLLNTTINANAIKTVELNYSIQKRGEQLAEVYISDYPDPTLTFDDHFLFSYTVAEKSNVLLLSNKKVVEPSNNILAVYANDENYLIESESFSNVDYSTLSSYSLVVLNNVDEISSGLKNELIAYLNKGGSVFLIPSEKINKTSYNEFFSSSINAQLSDLTTTQVKVGKLNKENTFYDGVFEKVPTNLDLPTVSSYYPTVYRTKSQTQVLMSLQNNSPFLAVSKVEKGSLYFMTSSLTQSTFTQHALFVPTLLKIAENSQVSYPLYYEIGEKGLITVNEQLKEGSVKIKEVDTDFEFIPEIVKNKNQLSIAVHDKIKRSNHYRLLLEENNSLPLAYNLTRAESDLRYFSSESLNQEIEKYQLSNKVQVIGNPSGGGAGVLEVLTADQKYWKLFIVGVLFFLLLEIALIRYLK